MIQQFLLNTLPRILKPGRRIPCIHYLHVPAPRISQRLVGVVFVIIKNETCTFSFFFKQVHPSSFRIPQIDPNSHTDTAFVSTRPAVMRVEQPFSVETTTLHINPGTPPSPPLPLPGPSKVRNPLALGTVAFLPIYKNTKALKKRSSPCLLPTQPAQGEEVPHYHTTLKGP